MRFAATLRHPDGDLDAVAGYFTSVVLPDGVEFTFNDSPVLRRPVVRVVPDAELPTPLFDWKTERVRSRVRTTNVQLLEKFGEKPMIYEMGIPVEEMPWSLALDVNVMQKTPLDIDRVMLPAKYKQQLVSLLVGPLSDLYAAHCNDHAEVPCEIRDFRENAQRLNPAAQAAAILAAVGVDRGKVVRRNPLDVNDRSESQELETLGYEPVNRAHLPAGISTLLADAPTVAEVHDRECKAHTTTDPDFPPETPRQRACMTAFEEIATALLGRRARCSRFSRGGAAAAWSDGEISLNIDHACLWKDPLGEESLGIILHECAHARVGGHSPEFTKKVARLGGKLAGWVGQNSESWRTLRHELGQADAGGEHHSPSQEAAPEHAELGGVSKGIG
jgi:hypothetical protein